MVTLIAAPSLLGEIEIKPFDKNKPQSTFNSEILRFYSDDIGKYRLGDLIVSDLGDKAMITQIANTGKGNSYAEARPVIRNRYRYHNLNKISLLGRMVINPLHLP